MTIPFGRHRLTITLARTPALRRGRDETLPVGMTDREWVRLSRVRGFDLDHARADALAVIYGGVRRP